MVKDPLRSHTVLPCSLFLAVLLAAGCGGSDGGGGGNMDAGQQPDQDAETGDPNTLVGGFNVRVFAPVAASEGAEAKDGYTTVVGKIYDADQPVATIWETAAEEGDCKLLTPKQPFCEAGCGGDVCVRDDVCQAYPMDQTVGDVTVTGIHTTDDDGFSMSPVADNYQPVGVTLAYPPFDEGENVTFAAAGSAFNGAFEIQSKGVLPFALEAGTLTLTDGQPLTVAWGAGADADAAVVHVALDISHHGGTKGKIECDTKDSGSITIAATLISQLLDLGVAGYPTIVVGRHAVGSTVISAGRVDLDIYSQEERAVIVPGLTSCTEDNDCPENQVCQADLSCK